MILSSLVTVRRALLIRLASVLKYLALRVLLPRDTFYPTRFPLPCQRMDVDLFSQLILRRTRSGIHQPLSPVSDCRTGIIMGFPTTLSMALVSMEANPSTPKT